MTVTGHAVECSADVDRDLHAVALRKDLGVDEGQRQAWATIRHRLSAGLRELIDLHTDKWSPAPRPRRRQRPGRR